MIALCLVAIVLVIIVMIITGFINLSSCTYRLKFGVKRPHSLRFRRRQLQKMKKEPKITYNQDATIVEHSPLQTKGEE